MNDIWKNFRAGLAVAGFMILGFVLLSLMRSAGETAESPLAAQTPTRQPYPPPGTPIATATKVIRPTPFPTLPPPQALSPTPTVQPTATPATTPIPGAFDARTLKIGAPTQVTNDDKFNANQVTPTDELLNYPVIQPWSPDSQRFLFRKMRTVNINGQWVSTSDSDLYVAPVNGAPHLLVNNASEASWSPDGSRIVYGLLRNINKVDPFVKTREGVSLRCE